MEFTTEGKEVVKSTEFRAYLINRLVELHKSGTSDEMGIAEAVSIIGWAATGHDWTKPPHGNEAIQLVLFVHNHAKEIDDLVADMMKTN